MRIMSNNAITKDEINQRLTEMDAKQNRQIEYLTIATVVSCAISILAFIISIMK